MKNPDEIKKGLECCSEDDCKKCPYWEDCKMADGFSELAGDALALIRQLQAENAEQAKKIRRLETENCKLSNRIDLLRSERYNSYGHAGPGIRDNY